MNVVRFARVVGLTTVATLGLAACGDDSGSNRPRADFTETGYALSSNGLDLVRLGATRATVTVSGLNGGSALLGIDYRPSDGLLYALGDDGQLYTLSATGVASPVGTPQSYGDLTEGIAWDVNAQPDAIRVVVTADGRNFVTNATTGVPGEFTPAAYNAGDPNAGLSPAVVATAYDKNVAPFPAGMTTIQYSVEANAGVLAIQGKNAGTLDTIAAIDVDITGASLDVSGATGLAYLLADDRLFQINLTDASLVQMNVDADGLSAFTIVP